LDHNPPVSESHSASPSTDSQPGGFEPKIEDDILSSLEPEHKAVIAKMPVMTFHLLLVLTDLNIVTTGFAEMQT
jgi:ATP adenylyltransferase/5',5'''-P-1,P-4-tetraphosphate phosphorylase II